MDIRILKVGDVIEGKVVQVSENTIFLDVQYFTEAKMHLDNYSRPELDSFIGVVKEGDIIKGRIQKIVEEPALILMSRLPLLRTENFDEIKKAVEEKTEVEAIVKRPVNKGLLLTYLDHEIFLPYSLLDYELIEQKEKLNGKKLTIQIIEAKKRGRFNRIVGSRKEIFQREKQEAYEERIKLREEELESIKTGDVLKGTVSKLEKHAANIKFEHVVGLLRISQVSHYRIDQLEDVLTLGQEVEVKVIKKEGNRLDLSMKALEKTPYEKFHAEHKVGDTITGTVFQKLPFGLIIEVAQDVRGLLHQSEYSWNPDDNYHDFVNIGDEVTLSIIQLDKKRERIALSKKALEDNPWKNVTVRRGELVKGIIRNIEPTELHVEVQGVLGIIPASEVSNEKIGPIEDYFAEGDEVEAVVIEANHRSWELKLSIKQAQQRKERARFEKYLESEENEDVSQTIGDLFAEELKE